MAKSKIDFISDLLKEKKLSPSNKEKIFKLIASDIKSIYDRDNDVKREKLKPDEVLQRNSSNETYISPKETSKFLNEFNQNPILKSTTHLIDINELESIKTNLSIEEYDFEIHLNAIKEEFKKLTKKYGISKKLYKKLHAYIHGGKEWSEEKISMSWSSAEVLEWAQQNPHKCPNPESASLGYGSCAIQRINISGDNPINNFTELVLFFKRQLHIRYENNLYELTQKWADEVNLNISCETLELSQNIDFFTDVEKFKQAFKHILKMCLEVPGTGGVPQISLNLNEISEGNEHKVIFSIYHKNSVFLKSLKVFRAGQSFSNLIKNQINGNCDFEIRCKCHNGESGLKPLWPEGNFVELPDVEGVNFNLIFYR